VGSSVIPLDQVVNHMTKMIAEGTLVQDPFPYHITDDVLPDDVFERLIADLPDVADLTPMSELGLRSMVSYDKHRTALFSEISGRSDPAIWPLVENAVLDSAVENSLREIFLPLVPAAADRREVKREIRLDCGLTGTSLRPHTDSPMIMMKTLIFLRAGSDHPSADTVLYRPKDPEARRQALGPGGDFTPGNYSHESAGDHVEAAHVKFVPNRMWSFFRTPASLHGLNLLTEEAAPRFIIAAHYKFASE
jgi:hypothetical protein